MTTFVETLSLGVVFIFLLVGLIGTIIPILPGSLLMWLTVLIYAFVDRFQTVSAGSVWIISLIFVVTGTADYWMSYLGAKKGGASRRAQLFGFVGAIAGTFLLPLLGTIIGYVVGLLLGEYQQQGDWDKALKVSVGGLAGWGVATAVQFIGGLFILGIFIFQLATG